MSRVTLSLPDTLSTFADQQVAGRGYDTSGDYLLDLIRADQDLQRLREQLLDGARSPATAPASPTAAREHLVSTS